MIYFLMVTVSMRIYEQVEASTVEAQDFLLHGIHLGPQAMANVAVQPGANVYPVILKANVAGRLIATSELFPNAAWKSMASVIVPSYPTQRAALGPVMKSELQGLSGNAYAFTADLQPVGNSNTNAATSDPVPYSVQLAVSNCAQACNVFVTLA